MARIANVAMVTLHTTITSLGNLITLGHLKVTVDT